jgi:acetylornithine deacetylase/succinyl-diaminopimelate desuccinylase-like protein
LIYGHYDVQPAEDVELWTSPPFEPRIEGDALYGRGASDNKGQIMAHLLSMRELEKQGPLPIQIKFIIEGEEEIGSPNLPGLLESRRQDLKADLVLVSDTSTVVKYLPTLHYSLRGIAVFEIFLEVAQRDVHSGVFGGTSPNAIHVLADIIGKLHDSEQRVTVPGFYDEVLPIDEWEAANLAQIPFPEETYKAFIGCSHLIGEGGFSTNERRWFRPTLECNGITGGFQGEGSKTIVPARASAKFSARLVAHQKADHVFEVCRRHLETLTPPYARLRFEPSDQGPPYLLAHDGPSARFLELARTALRESFGQEPVLTRHGGAIPIVDQFRSILGLDTILMGFGSPDDAIHSPNEKYELRNFFAGIGASQVFVRGLASRE